MAPTPTTAERVTPTALSKLDNFKKLTKEYVIDERDRAKVAYNEFSDDIPVISMAGFDEDYPGGRREEIMKKICEACEDWGILQVVDHGVDTKVMSSMAEGYRQFFARPDNEKLQLEMVPGTRGGFQISSNLQGEDVFNWRELFVFSTHPVNLRDYSRWPDQPKEWRAIAEAYSEQIMGLSHRVFELLSEGMGLEKDAILKSMGNIDMNVVGNHYPKCPEPQAAIGLKRHTDPSAITVVVQDHVGGLQATKDNGKTWVTVRPIKDAIVVNLGDYLYYMSNGRFKSADHQAIVNSVETRLSIPAFVKPQQEAMVYPLNVKEGEKSLLEEPITYTEMCKWHSSNYLEIVRIKKAAKEENWSQELLDYKLSQLKALKTL